MPKLLFTTLLILGVALVSIFYFIPEWERFLGIRDNIGKLEEASVEFDELLTQRDSLFEAVSRFSSEDRTRIEQTIPKGPEAGSLLVLIEQLTKRNGVLLNNINISTPVSIQRTDQPRPQGAPRPGGNETGSILELPIAIDIKGPYTAIKSFLRDIEKTIRITDVISITFNAGDNESIFTVTMRAKSYYIE